MSQLLKEQNVTKCVSLLKEFIEEAAVQGNKKGVAILALHHLQKITAGINESTEVAGCVHELRIFG